MDPRKPEIQHQEPADNILYSALGLEAQRTAFLTDPKRHTPHQSRIIENTRRQIEQLNPDQSKKLYSLILDTLAKEETSPTDQDRRDAALGLLDVMDLSTLNGQFLLTTYKQAVGELDKDADPLGSIDAMLTAGRKIAPYLPPGPGTQVQISDVWSVFTFQLPREDGTQIYREAYAIRDLVPKLDEDSKDLGWRDGPVLEKDQKELHDEYLRVTRERSTFKLSLWENTPEFRKTCEEAGVRLERFWNLSDPDQVATAISAIRKANSPIHEQFLNPALVAGTGLRLQEITPEAARVVADEILAATIVARGYILKSVGDQNQAVASSRRDADRAIVKFKELVGRANEINNPRAQRALLQQVSGFLTKNGVDVSDTTVEGLGQLLDDETALETVRRSYQSKISQRQAAAQDLEDQFRNLMPPQEFSLISRTEQDLFLGDLSGDCTAYHLNVGMNAWTVPVWLTNPGFTIFKIGDGANLTAKMGLLLGKSDRGPIIIIDSIETGKNITDEEEAEVKIKEGLHFINQWARRIGITQVLISNVSNSSELVEDLEGLSQPSELNQLEALGGLSGVAEVRRNLLGSETKERIYIQTESEEEDENTEDLELRKAAVADVNSTIENYINKAIEEANTDTMRERIVSLARNFEGDKLMPLLISANFPMWASIMGNQASTFREILDRLDVDEVGTIVGKGENESYNVINDYVWEKTTVDADIDNYSKLHSVEAEQYEDLIETLKLMDYFKISMRDVLKSLYKATEAQEGNYLQLNPKTPQLVI